MSRDLTRLGTTLQQILAGDGLPREADSALRMLDVLTATLGDGLRLICPDWRVHITGFVNHSFISTAVLRGSDAERHVFLSFSEPGSRWLADELSYAGCAGALFIGLGSGEHDDAPEYDLQEIRHGAGCLVLSAASLDKLSACPGEFSQQVIARGSGYVTSSLAAAAASGDPVALADLLGPDDRDVQMQLD